MSLLSVWVGGIIFPLLLGYVLIRLILGEELLNKPAMMAVAFGLGLGVTVQWMFLLAVWGVPLTFVKIFYPLAFLALFALPLALRRKELHAETRAFGTTNHCLPPARGFYANLAFVLLLFYVFYQVGFAFFRTWAFPVDSYDGIYVVAMKAKVFFFDGGVQKLPDLPVSSYPLQVPLSLAWMAFVLGRWEEPLIKTVFPMIFVSHLVMHYSILRVFVDRFWALLGVALLVSSNFFSYHASTGYHDPVLSYYNVGAIILLLLGGISCRPGYFVLAGFFSGFASFCKLEGSAYLFLHAVLAVYLLSRTRAVPVNEKCRSFLGFFVPAFSIYLFYCFFVFNQHLPLMEGRMRLEMPVALGERVSAVLGTFFETLFASDNWSFCWFLLFLSLISFSEKIRRCLATRFFLLALSLFFGLYLAVDLLTSNFHLLSGWGYPSILSRSVLHFFPLAVLLIILLNAPSGKEKR